MTKRVDISLDVGFAPHDLLRQKTGKSTPLKTWTDAFLSGAWTFQQGWENEPLEPANEGSDD